MIGSGAPPVSLDPSEPEDGAWSLTRALEHAYYSRDVEALRRIAHQVERQIAELRKLVKPASTA